MVVCIANNSEAEQSATIRLLGPHAPLHVEEAIACILDRKGDPANEIPDTAKLVDRQVALIQNDDGSCSFHVTLPPDSTLTVILDSPPADRPD